jgi:integrase/recombinase XerD
MDYQQPLGPPWWRELCTGYLLWLVRKGRMRGTLVNYAGDLRFCGRWLEQEGITGAEQLTGSQLERWQDLRATQIAPSSLHIAVAAVRGVLRWGASQDPPLVAPALWLRMITARTGVKLPKPIPRQDLERLLAALAPAPPADDLWALRTRALFFVILTSGARISEALQLERDQFQDRTATVIQKGGSEKLLVISAGAEIAVRDYQAARRDSCRALFVAYSRGPRPALEYREAQDGWNRLCAELGIKRFTHHRIRHSCATELLRQHVDSIIIAKHMGHRGLKSIEGYSEVGLDMRHEMLVVMDGRMRPISPKTPASELSDEELASAEAEAFRAYEALRAEGLQRAVRELLEAS